MSSEEDRGIGIKSWLAGQKPKSRTPENKPHQVILDKHRIAVLPFSNISPDIKDEYFADGMTEELISTISTMRGLRVISRTSAMNYKNSAKKLVDIAKELNVGVAIEGSVRKAGNSIRITVQLIDAKTDEHLWSNSYDRQLDDIFAIQSDIAKQVSNALSVRIGESESERISKIQTENKLAYQHYLMGKHLLGTRREESIRRSIQYFENATKEDPSFAEAWASLAAAHELLGHHSFAPFEESYKISKAMANKALEIDLDSANAHAVLGMLFMSHDWKFTEAEKELRTSINLNSSNSLAHRAYSRCLATLGRLNEAVHQAELAVEHDPLNPPCLDNKGLICMIAGREEEAWDSWRQVRELFPDYADGAFFPVYFLMNDKRYSEAEQELGRLNPSVMEEPLFKFLQGHLYARTGRREDALRVLGDLRELCEKGYASEDQVAIVYAGLGDIDEFFKWMTIAVEKRHAEPVLVKNHLRTFSAEIATDRRWKELLKKGGMT